MKQFLPLLFAAILFSCSKPGTGDSPTDSTAGAAYSSPDSQPITLSAEEAERVNFYVFLKLHDEQLYDGDPEVMAYKEEFTTNNNEFTYILLRHNGSKAGWHTPEEASGSEESDESESSPYGESSPEYGESEPEPQYTNEIDTIEVRGRYMAFSASPPESQVKTVKVVFIGKIKRVNVPYEDYGEIKSYVVEDDISRDLVIDLTTTLRFNRDYLYLKAKIADLSEQDLAEFSKDELGFIRNEIFARHGHTFKTNKMVTYFEQKDWYHSLVDDALPLLNKFEKRNVDFIKKREG